MVVIKESMLLFEKDYKGTISLSWLCYKKSNLMLRFVIRQGIVKLFKNDKNIVTCIRKRSLQIFVIHFSMQKLFCGYYTDVVYWEKYYVMIYGLILIDSNRRTMSKGKLYTKVIIIEKHTFREIFLPECKSIERGFQVYLIFSVSEYEFQVSN